MLIVLDFSARWIVSWLYPNVCDFLWKTIKMFWSKNDVISQASCCRSSADDALTRRWKGGNWCCQSRQDKAPWICVCTQNTAVNLCVRIIMCAFTERAVHLHRKDNPDDWWSASLCLSMSLSICHFYALFPPNHIYIYIFSPCTVFLFVTFF